MIVLHLIEWACGLMLFVVGLCSLGIAATWVAKVAWAAGETTVFMDSVWLYLRQMGVWIPFGMVGPALLIAATVWFSQWCIKIGRMLLSLFTGGGGSAA
jgi:hypothetical protein